MNRHVEFPVVFGPKPEPKPDCWSPESEPLPRTSRLRQFPKPRLNGGFDLVWPRIPGIIPIGNAEMTGNAVPFCTRPSLEEINRYGRTRTVRPSSKEPSEQCKTSVAAVIAAALREFIYLKTMIHARENLDTFL